MWLISLIVDVIALILYIVAVNTTSFVKVAVCVIFLVLVVYWLKMAYDCMKEDWKEVMWIIAFFLCGIGVHVAYELITWVYTPTRVPFRGRGIFTALYLGIYIIATGTVVYKEYKFEALIKEQQKETIKELKKIKKRSRKKPSNVDRYRAEFHAGTSSEEEDIGMMHDNTLRKQNRASRQSRDTSLEETQQKFTVPQQHNLSRRRRKKVIKKPDLENPIIIAEMSPGPDSASDLSTDPSFEDSPETAPFSPKRKKIKDAPPRNVPKTKKQQKQ